MRRAAAAALVSVVVLVPVSGVAAAQAVPPTPVPAPSAGAFVAGAWTCTDRYSASPTTPPLAAPTTVDVKVGDDCAASTWTPVSPASPSVVAVHEVSPEPVPLSCGSATCAVRLDETQYRVYAMYGGVVVLLLGAGFVIWQGAATRTRV